MAYHSRSGSKRDLNCNLSANFGSKVRATRKKLGWSLETLAEKAGLHVTYLSSIERGHRNPTLNVINALSVGLKTTPSRLLSGVNEELKC